MKTVYFVTGNAGKVREAKAMLEKLGIGVQQIHYEYPEIQSDDLESIAKYGARDAAMHLKRPVMVEDAGMFISALKGFPGPYSSFTFKCIGNEGILKLMRGVEDRNAQFRSVIGFCEPDKEVITFSGSVEGEISNEPRGKMGFGYDPIFLYQNKTFAQMSTEEKNEVSHRCVALRKFAEWFCKDI
ncbi:MAG: XTP/dITP diphosphatase [Methanocellales archaeon]|nr:XTP/dITP diphosphatase [Methanocellales archaeon]MDD3292291.1 XTP/dITP diphosphatase [Methanocellales archaeon]MDD5235599.1 XTP/dITP diphosphatase [Methanocellales archaeon]MDD5485754.1 XTP/dITP diphosphatase [Methanocellales archaeon]